MKKILIVSTAFLFFFLPAITQEIYQINPGIEKVAKELSDKLPQGSKVVILDITAEKPEASEYIIEELTLELLRIGKLVLVDRQSLEAIRSELSFQISGEVSDESAQKLGSLLGAQSLVTGSFDLRNDKYRFAVKAVKVETSEIQYLTSLSVAMSAETETLFGRKLKSDAVGKAARGVASFTGRLVCSVINPALGLGSFLQGDIGSGLIVAGCELVGVGAVAYGYDRKVNGKDFGPQIATGGLVVLGGGVIFSLIRPWTYTRAPKIAEALENMQITYTSSDNLSAGYIVRY